MSFSLKITSVPPKLKLNQAQKSKGQNAKAIKLTEIEKLLFAHGDESDDSDEDMNDQFGGGFGAPSRLGSHREEGLQVDSNEGSSVIQANNLTTGGRPQRKPKSKNLICNFIITS